MQGADNMIGMLQHGFSHLSLNGFVELVDLLVTKNDFARQIRLAIDKGVQRLPQHISDHLSHGFDRYIQPKRLVLHEFQTTPRNRGGLIPDSFQLIGNAHGHRDESNGFRLGRLSKHGEGQFIHLHFKLIDDVVLVFLHFGQGFLTIHERLNGYLHAFLSIARHQQKMAFKGIVG